MPENEKNYWASPNGFLGCQWLLNYWWPFTL